MAAPGFFANILFSAGWGGLPFRFSATVLPWECYIQKISKNTFFKYLLRLSVFALISQPFWILAFNADEFMDNLFNLNIFFTLVVSLAAAWGFKEKKWILFAGGFLLLSFINFDYSVTA